MPLKYFGFYKQEENARLTMFPVSHLDKQEKQAQLFSFFLRKYYFHINQISSRDYTDIDVSKYQKVNSGKTIFWPWVLKTPGVNCQKIQIGNFGGSRIWLKQALERVNRLQKYLLSSCLLPTFS